MLDNIGRKIKVMVIVVTIIGLISCVILFFVGNAAYNEDKDLIKYATVNGGAYGYPSLQAAGDDAYNGLQLRNLMLVMIPCLLIGALPLYGFGELIEETTRNRQINAEILRILSQQEKNVDTKSETRDVPVAFHEENKNSEIREIPVLFHDEDKDKPQTVRIPNADEIWICKKCRTVNYVSDGMRCKGCNKLN